MNTPRPIYLIFLLFISLLSAPLEAKEIKVMLLGDSTTEGGTPHFEQTIEQLLAADSELPDIEVVNVGKGGETCFKLFASKRYQREVAVVKNVDYLFVRYGINDWFSRQPLAEAFAEDYRKMLTRLRKDHPKAQIILMTIIPFLKSDATIEVNTIIADLAKSEGLPLFDIHPVYQKWLEEQGRYSMNTRFYPLKKIPEQFHEIVKPFTSYSSWKKEDYVRVHNNELDPILGHLPGWYSDSHPNPTGYRLLARETAQYLRDLLKREAKR